MTKPHLIVIGNGMAGCRAVEEILARDPDKYRITIFGAEPRVNYNRIMLSPLLAGEKSFEDIVINDHSWYADNSIDLVTGDAVVAIDRKIQTVTARSGRTESYDKLIFATGSDPFIIPVPGHDLQGVVTFRDMDDVGAMLRAATGGGNAVVIGGGLLGLEAAHGLSLRGMDVTVIHLMDTLMERQLDEAAGWLLKIELESRGQTIFTGADTAEIFGQGKVQGVRLKDGREIPCSIVVMAVGIRPNVKLMITSSPQTRTYWRWASALSITARFTGWSHHFGRCAARLLTGWLQRPMVIRAPSRQPSSRFPASTSFPQAISQAARAARISSCGMPRAAFTSASSSRMIGLSERCSMAIRGTATGTSTC
jgi:NAD(P)H-nitrite reductase large subunit